MEDDPPVPVPEWIVTYGDLMSLLLTFFIMLVSLSEVAAEQKYRAVVESLQQYLGYSSAPPSPPGKNFPMNSILESLQEMKLGSVTDDEKGKGGIRQKAPPGQDLQVLRLKEGEGQIVGSVLVFAGWQTKLTSQNLQQLEEIAQDVAGKPHKLEIRAFSSAYQDGRPLAAEERMQLSYQRAGAVLEELVRLRVEQKRLRIAVYFQNPENATQEALALPSDRVEVMVLDQYADSYRGREEDYR